MTELSPEQKRLLTQLRDVDEPTRDERSSADAAVRRMLRAQGVSSPPPLPAALPSAPPTIEVVAARGGVAKLIWGWGAVVVATLGLFAVVFFSSHAFRNTVATPDRKSSAAAPSSAPPSTALAPPAASPVSALPPRAAPPEHTQRALDPRPSTTKEAHSSLADELRFVSSVDAEIRSGAYDRALYRLSENHSKSQLREERAALRVLALCGRSHDTEAARARAQFLKSSPSSVLAGRVRAACPGEPTP